MGVIDRPEAATTTLIWKKRKSKAPQLRQIETGNCSDALQAFARQASSSSS
jgi:hypothetical protein